tara:strand:- start:85905 stop:86315 length:411 start_codon:yes stop_codon:yes gene_type:complete
MTDKSTNIKERVLEVAKYHGVSYVPFCKEIGLTYGNFTGKSKLTPINSNALKDILLNYPDVNPRWLILGEGNMLIDENEFPSGELKSEGKHTLKGGLSKEEENYKELYETTKIKLDAQKEVVESLKELIVSLKSKN